MKDRPASENLAMYQKKCFMFLPEGIFSINLDRVKVM